MRITYTKELLEVMSIFARSTGAEVKDCFEIEEVLYFVVQPGNIGKAVGKNGETVRNFQEKLKRRVRVIEYTSNLMEFVKHIVYPVKVDDVHEENGVVVLKSNDRSTRALLIGRNAKNLNRVKDMARRYFQFTDIRVE